MYINVYLFNPMNYSSDHSIIWLIILVFVFDMIKYYYEAKKKKKKKAWYQKMDSSL